MKGVLSKERLFSLSCFEGLRLLQSYGQDCPRLSTAEILKLVMRVEADAAGLDMEAAAYLHQSDFPECPLDGKPFYQGCIKAFVITYRPVWAKSMRQGRIRFAESLSKDNQDVFRAAGLLQSSPSMEVVSWWDDIVGHARLAIDIEKILQARKAERLTINHEEKRLNELGISKPPKWPGLDDNYAGYDVLSYDIRNGHEVNRMIEVKSTVASPLRFYLSRNEWKTAVDAGDAYFFHVWDMAAVPPKLNEFTVAQVRPHIPVDNEKGKWSNAEIPIGALK